MQNPITVKAAQKVNNFSTQTKQFYCVVPSVIESDALCRFIDSAPEFYGFVFCPTKILTGEVAEKLITHEAISECIAW